MSYLNTARQHERSPFIKRHSLDRPRVVRAGKGTADRPCRVRTLDTDSGSPGTRHHNEKTGSDEEHVEYDE